jgi:hypothetical protein
MGKIYLLNEDGSATEIESVHCKNEEKELQQLLVKNLNLLPGEQINPEEPRKWLLIKREMPIEGPSAGGTNLSLDFFLVDQNGIPTFVECKRFLDTRSRREVVGQMLDYAANGQYYFDRDTLQKYLTENAKAQDIPIESLIQNYAPESGDSVEDFLDMIENNMQEGQIRMIFFMEEAPIELKSIVDFLNKQMERSEVLIVEAKQYQKGKMRFVTPSLFGYTEQARRIKKTVTVKQAARGQWDYDRFFEHLTTQVPEKVSSKIKDFYDLCADNELSIRWGTGKETGSFSLVFPQVIRKSLLSIYSNGKLSLNFGWLNEGEKERALRDTFFQQLRDEAGFNLTEQIKDKYPSFSYKEWIDKIVILRTIIEKLGVMFPAK